MTSENKENIGCMLREAREAQGLSVAKVANDLKLLDDYIEGLEAGDYSKINGDVFVRGYIRSYGAYLKLDPNVLMSQYYSAIKVDEPVLENNKNFAVNVMYIPILVLGLLIFFIWFDDGESEKVISSELATPVQKSQKTSNVSTSSTVASPFVKIDDSDDVIAFGEVIQKETNSRLQEQYDDDLWKKVELDNSQANHNKLSLSFVDDCWCD